VPQGGAATPCCDRTAETVTGESRLRIGDLAAGWTVYALAMTTIVVPFAGSGGKTRLRLPVAARRSLSLAMLVDVLAACAAVGRTYVVTPDPRAAALAAEAGAAVVPDPGGGQGAAVQGALEAAERGAALVVNADLPCATADDLLSLLAATPVDGLALVEAPDGTTNALSLPRRDVFAPLFGRGSAARFREHAAELGLEVVSVPIPNLAEDVDTLEDAHRLQPLCGPSTRACLAELSAGVAL
jgi:2-phospho-L-lactate guanylyltransferase